MSRYASRTAVPASKTRGEIEAALKRYGADQFIFGSQAGKVVLGFRYQGRMVRFNVPMPDEDKAPQAFRSRWRAVLLSIKAKLESVQSGIEEFDDAFMAQIVLPNGQTMSDHAKPLIARAYESGSMPPLLPYLGDAN
jgi:hypothetical protein